MKVNIWDDPSIIGVGHESKSGYQFQVNTSRYNVLDCLYAMIV